MPVATTADPTRAGQWRGDFVQGGDPELAPNLYTFALNSETPDAWQIVTALSNFAQQYGANPTLRKFVESLFPPGLGNNDLPGQYNAVATFVLEKMTYVADPLGVEYVTSPLLLIQSIQDTGTAYGDCDDHVLLFNSMLSSLGFETHVVGVQADPGASELFTHVLSLVKLAGNDYFFDACNKANPYAVPSGNLLII